jgi:RNA polymerase sigma factor (TIGR02999 family)
MTKGEAVDPQPAVTALLVAWRHGDAEALTQLMPLVYDELKRIAHHHWRRERAGITIQATALAHEAYIRLVDIQHVHWKDRAHFFAMASRLMRRVLVDGARARNADKRGAGMTCVTFDESLNPAPNRGADLLALDGALERLAGLDARKARVVEMRVFGGLTLEETASALEVSVDTVARDWKFVKSWLRRELKAGDAR